MPSENKNQPSFDDDLIQVHSTKDTPTKTYQSYYSALSDIITDKYVAKNPKGNFINLSYSDKSLVAEWDKDEVSSIVLNHISCNIRSDGVYWKNSKHVIDSTTGKRIMTDHGFYQYIVTDKEGNTSYSYALIASISPNYYHNHIVNEEVMVPIDFYMEDWTLYLNDGSTETIKI